MTTRKLLAIHIASALGLSLAAPVFAADEAQKDEDIERLEVVGSRIKRSDVEGANPVLTISRESIDKSGYTNLGQLLEKLPSTGSGTFSTRGNNQDSTANGAAGISLRGFGADATLVLLNGRRTALSSFASDIATNFTDLNSIPVSAIERVEVLKDGASALYGADAVAGVVNIVLRKDVEGIEVNAGYGNTTDTDNHENTASLVWGFGDDKGHGTLIFDYFANSALMNKDRGFDNANQSARGGFDLRSSRSFPGSFFPDGYFTVDDQGRIKAREVADPTCPADRRNGAGSRCFFNYGPYNVLIPRSERTGATFLGHRELSSAVEFFTEVQVQHNTSEAQGAPTPIDGSAGLTFNANALGNPFRDTNGNLVGGRINRFRPIDTGPRRWDIETDNLRLLAGLRGDIGDWEWETGVQKARSESTQRGTQGWVNRDKLQAAIDANIYQVFGSHMNNQAALDAIATNVVRQGESHLTSWDASLTGPLAELSTGTLSLAAGVEWREEDAKDTPDQQFIDGKIPGTEAISAEGSRDQKAAYVELAIPLWERAEMQLAGRYDDYSDFGSTVNPKVGLRWQPVEALTLRGSWGTGFRAPSLAQVGLGPSQESQFAKDRYLCIDQGIDPNSDDCSSLDNTITFTGNPNLDAEETESWNVGAIWQATDSLSLSADWWSIRQDNKIDRYIADIYAAECNNQASTICVRSAPETGDTLGELVTIFGTFNNQAYQEASGLDLVADYRIDMGAAGNLKLNVDWSYTADWERQRAKTSAVEELAGEYNYPEYRWTGSADWTMGDLGLNATVYYIGEFEDAADPREEGFNHIELKGRTVDSMTTLSLQARYMGIQNTVLSVGIDNALDEEPPFVIGDENNDLYGYASSTHSPRGRFVYGKVSYRF